MAFTKVVGPGIHTLSNILSHNINSSGIITATQFDGPFSNIVVGGATTLTVDGINISAGILTAKTLDLNGNGDISGNLVLGGDLTVNGTTTTLDTNLIGVDRVEIGAAGAVVGLAVTQSGSADLVRLYDGSTQVVTVDDEGNVGLGSAIPSAKLQVANGHINVSSGYSFQWGDTHERIEQSDGKIEFFTNNGEQMTLSGSNLGIGSAIPSQKLHVFGSGDQAILIQTTGTDDSKLQLKTSQRTWNVENVTGGTFRVRDGSINSTRLSIDSAGEVGIQTSSPATIFHVYGSSGTTPSFLLESATYKSYIGTIQSAGNLNNGSLAGDLALRGQSAISFSANNGTATQVRITSTGVSFGDLNLTNVGTIACDSLKGDADDNTNITFAGNDVITFKAGTTSPALTVNTTQVKVEDGHYIVVGTGNDFKIHHDNVGSTSDTIDSGSGYLYINSDALRLNSKTSAWNYLRGDKSDGVVKLYKSNSQRLATSDTGITVTGEVASSQDYPNFRPTTDFNFAKTKRLDPNIRYYRTGTASYTDEDGFIRVVGEGEPRFDHDPATKESLGLLIEESRTNMVNHSENLGYSTWSMNNAATRFKPTTEAPDGKTSDGGAMVDGQVQAGVWEIVETSSSSTHLVYQQLSGGNVSTNTNYHISAFAKPGLNRTHFCLTEGNTLSATAIFDVANGTVTHTFGTGSPTAKISGPYGDGWYRCVLRYTTTASQSTINIQLGVAQNGTTNSYAGDGSSSIAVWGVQIERTGTSETSYIQNWGRNNTRGREYIEVQNPNERFPLTVVSETSTKEFNYARRPFAMSPLGATDTIRPFINDSGNLLFFSSYNSSSYASHAQSETGLAVNIPFKYAYAISSTSVSSPDKSCVNGGAVKSSGNTSLTETKLTQYRIGYSSAGDAEREWMGHVRRFMIYDTFLSDGNLKTVTS